MKGELELLPGPGSKAQVVMSISSPPNESGGHVSVLLARQVGITGQRSHCRFGRLRYVPSEVLVMYHVIA